jgi:NadR type nicotinamide-nucleotide adenylyltransferase
MEKGSKENIKRIVLIGAESTGKTELADYLANAFNTVFVPEYAREYIENLDRNYTYDDVEYIAKKQVELEEKYFAKANGVLFYDTYLIITKIWFQIAFDEIPKWIENKLQNCNIDLFLLCNNDLPWIPDPVRENGGKMRDQLFHMYEQELIKYGFNYRIIDGEDHARYTKALNIVNDYLNQNTERGKQD